MEIKKVFGVLTCTLVFSIGLSGCSSDEDSGDGGGLTNMSQLVGSEWKRNYSWMNDDGSYEKGEGTLKFTSSNSAHEDVTYHGKEWRYNYDLDVDEYKSYHGERTNLYTYTVSGNTITMTDLEYDNEIVLRLSDGMLVAESGSDDVWQLVKAGDGIGEGTGGASYTWADLQGIWADEVEYGAYKSEIAVYRAQGSPSSTYTDNAHHGNFRVYCMEFDGEGNVRDLYPYMRTVYNSGYPLLMQFMASDGQMVYWTDLKPDSWERRPYVINGNKLYQNGVVRFEILRPGQMVEVASGTFYTKVDGAN